MPEEPSVNPPLHGLVVSIKHTIQRQSNDVGDLWLYSHFELLLCDQCSKVTLFLICMIFPVHVNVSLLGVIFAC